MSETLTFGPEWLRALSSGNSVTSPPPSPGPKFKLADFRYGKEEMLAMFIEELTKPVELERFASIAKEKANFPLAFQPPTEEEQRTALGSVNSNAVLKLMGRGGTRGGMRGARGSIRGRGRGDGGFMRQTSQEDGRTEGGFGRDPRRQSWDENRRGGYDPARGTGRGYDPTARPRLASDNSWDRAPDDWRSAGRNDDDDGGGWRVSGSRSIDKTDRWRGTGRPTRGGTWRNSDSFRREGGFAEEEWQVARGSRARSWHEKDEGRWGAPTERLPEWSHDDHDDYDVTGTFDSSGAFRSLKKDTDNRLEGWEQTNDRSSTSNEKHDEHNHKESSSSRSKSFEDIKDEKDSLKEKPLAEEKAPAPNKRKSPSPPPTSTSAKATSIAITEQQSPSSTQPSSQSSAPSQHHSTSPVTVASLPKHQNRPPALGTRDNRKEEDQSIDHLEKAKENLAMLLDDEDEEKVDEKRVRQTSGQQRHSPATSPVNSDDVKWYYTDPQGKQQGSFTNAEMADWFKHGYFTMNLMVRRMTDEVFTPLGELIKSWGRVPFHPGPQPQPLKSIPEHIQQQQQQQQQLLAQQQYQDLMRQHLLQQQFLQQQAYMMQQQQLQQMQLQQAQQSTLQHPAPDTSLAPPQLQAPPTAQGESPRIDLPAKQQQEAIPQQTPQQQQQQQRPQGLAVSSESVWGPSGSPQTSPSMISPSPWSPVNTPSSTTAAVAAAKAWDVDSSNKSKVQSLQEIQRMEEEKERKIKMERERKEAEVRAVRQKQIEDEERRRQQELLLQRKREEEERRRQQEELERKQREHEELIKKQQDEARKKQEEELRRKQQEQQRMTQQEQQKRQEQQRQQQLEQQKRQQDQQRLQQQQLELQKRQQEEKQRMLEMRQQQQQALLRLQQQQQEMQRRKDMQQQLDLQQKLQQKRQQVSNGSLWGTGGAPSTPSLAQIQQQQEERDRLQRERQRLVMEQQEREHQNRAVAAGWGEHAPVGPPPVKSLLEIQQEQQKSQQPKKKTQHSQSLSQSQPPPSHNPLSSSVWGTNSSLSASWGSSGGSAGVWGGSKQPPVQQSRFIGISPNDDDDDDDDDEDDESFWDDAVKAATKANPPPRAQQPSKKNHAPVPSAVQTKAQNKKPNKDEESVRRLFQQRAASGTDEFTQWCDHALRSMKASGVDIPTFIMFLKEVDSPYEIHDYVKSYIGDTKDAREFAKEFIERQKGDQRRIPASHSSPALYQGNVWGAPQQQQGRSNKTSAAYAYQQSTGIPMDDFSQSNSAGGESAASKKKKKKKMQKVDPSILGFSVNAAERVNMGEIQTLEDNR